MRTALVCIAKNEDYYIQEWIDYHKLLGFDRIFIYQNNWHYPIHDSAVQIISIPGKNQQMPAYNHFIEHNIKNYDWAAFIDVDEFILLKKHNTIQQFIEQYQDYSAIAINFVLYGSNYLTFDGDYNVLKRFTKCSEKPDHHIKIILKLRKGVWMTNPHFANVLSKDTSGNEVNGPFNPNGSNDVAQINHYWYKTEFEFKNKMDRGRADIGVYDVVPHAHLHNEIEDFTILNRIKELTF